MPFPSNETMVYMALLRLDKSENSCIKRLEHVSDKAADRKYTLEINHHCSHFFIQVIPARGHANVNFTFTPFPTEEVVKDMDCEGFALGYMSLDKVKCSFLHVSISYFFSSKF